MLFFFRKFNRYFFTKGSVTLELLIAFAILILNITAVILILNGGQSIYIDSETNTEALFKAKSILEQTREKSKIDFNLVSPRIITEPEGPIVYTKKINVDQLNLFTKEISSSIEWNALGGRTLKIELKTLLTNPEALKGGDTCSSVLEGDWKNPEMTSYAFGADILGDTSSGFPITSIQVFKNRAYVTVNNDNGNNDGTFFILNISNPEQKPEPEGFLDNSLTVSEGLNAVAVDGESYAFVANGYDSASSGCDEGDNCAQLQVINISNPHNPHLIRNFKIQSTTSGGKLAYGTSIFYQDGIVYLGLAKSNNQEFYILDVSGKIISSASPSNPAKISSFEVGNGVNAIFKKNNYIYLASPNDQELKILNISDLYNPTLVGGFDAPGGGGNYGNGKSLSLVGDSLFLGRTLLNGNEFYILDKKNPEINLPILGFKDIKNGTDNSSVNGIVVRDYLVFLITNSEFQILNIEDPSNITEFTDPLILPPGTGGVHGTATDCEGNYIYVGSEGSNDKGYFSIVKAL